ncbi:MAG: hypothetical protein KZQ64_16290 [gamma proteobacterium symbiont of Bathyaustriella thionipta]|nr:hypothetical protein [gamma proteobacterium symbiont of Bathyaustriella thionipta]MCU7950190.1 hypothetical protein [gamma proteobacterium symbiont of Bathyaustriella thionipta]MCU7954927.1 hypothetical protein [gamma proteobacterium symbiont of Bathyaustriella thionipta]MCU7958042.1 hypothetical protein [gamma proteobacterium symbiont of Bathyaustriella thionipta]MCU7967189.1 hypothetical protein [gamma proteobacterium symbiont of Bathyaustriella thionipta]
MKSKRTFIKTILGLPLLGFNYNVTAKQTTQLVLLNKCSIAGFQYYQGQKLISKINKKETLILIAEPENQFDKYAVEVYYQATKLGYIPRNENKHISRILRAGVNLHAKVYAVDVNKKSWGAVEAAVYLQV